MRKNFLGGAVVISLGMTAPVTVGTAAAASGAEPIIAAVVSAPISAPAVAIGAGVLVVGNELVNGKPPFGPNGEGVKAIKAVGKVIAKIKIKKPKW